jgi:SAM-dependent methyltransferase
MMKIIMKAFNKIKNFLITFDRTLVPAPLNYPIYFQIKNTSKNILSRVIRSQFHSRFKKDYEVITNERIVEIPFVYQNLSLSKRSTVLDFGCCESKLSIELASLGYIVTGVDVNDFPLTHPNFHFVKGNFLKNTFLSESFDAVIAISSIEHCGLPAYGAEEFSEGDIKVVEEIYRILNKGGRFILTVPFGKMALVSGPFGYRVYDWYALKSLLSKFSITAEEYFVGRDRQYWLPVTRDELSKVDSVSKGFVQGVACIVAAK